MSEVFAILWQIFSSLWWLILFVLLLPLAGSALQFWRQERYKNNLKWLLLEIRIPREIKRSPKAMEQILFAIHQLRNAPGSFKEIYMDGEVTDWTSLEIVSLGGEVHYYIRFPEKKRNVVEAAIYSYYPDVELAEVDDYTDRFPKDVAEMKRWGYNFYGTEIVLRKDPAFPIRSYIDFETMVEEAQLDPAAALLEVLSKAKPEEMIGLQFLIAPAGDDWRIPGQHIVEKMRESKGSPSQGPKSSLVFNFEHGPLPHIDVNSPQKKDEQARAMQRSPGETDLIKAMETNLSRPAFNTLIRLVYLSPEQTFYDAFPKKGVVGALNQYSTNDLNSFKTNPDMETKTQVWTWPHVFSKTRNLYRKQRALLNYRKRNIPVEPWIGQLLTSHFFNWNFKSRRVLLNTMSIATLFHPPTQVVLTAPHIQRVDSRKAGPPAGLAIFGDESDIERFQ